MANNKEASLLLKIKQAGAEILDRIVITFEDLTNIAKLAAEFVSSVREKIIELVKEGEKVQQINNSFDALAKSAGLSADVIRDQLVGAAKGLADDTDIIQAANKGVIALGVNAEKMPQIMELARKATSLFGGDLVQNFEAMGQAIAAGNTRVLRHFGLIIDSEQVTKKYAASIGIMSNELTESGKAHAILNAVLEQGDKAYKNVDESTMKATNSQQRAHVAWAQLGEAIALATNKMAGGAITASFENMASKVQYLTDKLVSYAGSGAEKASASTRVLQADIERLKASVETEKSLGNSGMVASLEQALTAKQAQMERIRADEERQMMMLEKSRGASRDREAAAESAATAQKSEINKEYYVRKQSLVNQDITFNTSLIGASYERDLQAHIAYLNQKIANTEDTNKKIVLLKEQQDLLTQQQNFKRAEDDRMNVQMEEEFNLAMQSATFDQQLAIQLSYLDKKIQQEADAKQRQKLLEQRHTVMLIQAGEKIETFNKEKDEREMQQREVTLGKVAALQNSKNREMMMVGKAAAVAQIGIDTYRGAIAAYASLAGIPFVGPALGVAAAALITAFGVEQAARVSGVQMAEGGVVKARPGGIQATIGEGGRDEAVVPLEDGKMPGGGSTFNIVVYGGMLGDQSSAREFAVAVDRELMKLRQSNESVAFDGGLT